MFIVARIIFLNINHEDHQANSQQHEGGVEIYLHSLQRVVIIMYLLTENVFKSSELLVLLKATQLPRLLTKYRKNFIVSSCEIRKSSKTLLGTRNKCLDQISIKNLKKS